MSILVGIEIGHVDNGTTADPGGVVGKVRETDINLDVGRELVRQLKRHGIGVITNRNNLDGTDVQAWAGLRAPDFVKVCAVQKLNLSVSVHFNKGGGDGAELYMQMPLNRRDFARQLSGKF